MMNTRQIISKTQARTIDIGKQTGCFIKNLVETHQMGEGFHIALIGDLGAGKTTFVKGLARGLDIPEDYYITSPTFNIINEYPAGGTTLCHIDLYRLGSVDELEYTGFYDLVSKGNIMVVEWPQMLTDENFVFDLTLSFNLDDPFLRKILLSASGQRAANLLQNLVFKNK
jgi:tRNA threonylcarbamoyladenosine biosynthesis protein TsaE